MSRLVRCLKTGKVRFGSSAEAEAELAQARRLRAEGEFGVSRRDGQATVEGRVEQRVHPCFQGSRACGGWHLTAMAQPRPDLVPKPKRGRRR